MPRRYRALFALPGFGRLLFATVVGRLPLGMASLAVLLDVRSSTHSFATAGIAVGAFAIAQAAMAPIVGGAVDRLGPAPILVSAAVAQAAFLIGLMLACDRQAGGGVLVGLAAGAGASMPPVSACARMLWPQITPDRQMAESAYALDATAQEVVWTAGPFIVGVLAGAVSDGVAGQRRRGRTAAPTGDDWTGSLRWLIPRPRVPALVGAYRGPGGWGLSAPIGTCGPKPPRPAAGSAALAISSRSRGPALPANRGSATFTIETSTTRMNWIRPRTASARQRLGSGWATSTGLICASFGDFTPQETSGATRN